MAIYEGNGTQLTLTEQPFYGSDRLGSYRTGLPIDPSRSTLILYEDPNTVYVLQDYRLTKYTGQRYVVKPGKKLTLGNGLIIPPGGVLEIEQGEPEANQVYYARQKG